MLNMINMTISLQKIHFGLIFAPSLKKLNEDGG